MGINMAAARSYQQQTVSVTRRCGARIRGTVESVSAASLWLVDDTGDDRFVSLNDIAAIEART